VTDDSEGADVMSSSYPFQTHVAVTRKAQLLMVDS